MNIGKTIATLRKENNMTQSEVADKLGVSYQAVSKWERDESLPDITLLPMIADLFGITIDQLLRGGLEMNEQEVIHAKEIVEEASNDKLNQEITEFVNQQFEEGYANGNPPTTADLGEKISEFVNKTITESFANAFEGLMPFMKPKKIKKMMKNYKADLKSFSSNAYEYMDEESLDQLFDSIDEIDADIYEKILEIIVFCNSSTRDRIVDLLCESDLEDLELAAIMPFISNEHKTKLLEHYLENTSDYDQVEEIIVFLNKEQKKQCFDHMKDEMDYETIEDLAPFLDGEILHECIVKYIEEENDEDISGLYPFLNDRTLKLLKKYYLEKKMIDELNELFDFL